MLTATVFACDFDVPIKKIQGSKFYTDLEREKWEWR